VTSGASCRGAAFGLDVSSAIPLPGLRPPAPGGHPLSVAMGSEARIRERWSGSDDPPVWETVIDGRRHAMSQGRDGDHLLVWEGGASFHLSAGAGELLCAPARAGYPAWRRFMLDTVLWSTSLLAGYELMHASTVERGAGLVAIAGPSGSGKSALAIELSLRGARLFGDDILALAQGPGGVIGHPGPALANAPAGRLSGMPASWLGRRLARFPGEDWIELAPGAAQATPLAAVCILQHGPGSEHSLTPLTVSVRDLLPHTLGFRHLRHRLGARVELFARVAAEVPVYRLAAGLDASPATLADVVEPLLDPARDRAAAV
jgi:hypothetical protein